MEEFTKIDGDLYRVRMPKLHEWEHISQYIPDSNGSYFISHVVQGWRFVLSSKRMRQFDNALKRSGDYQPFETMDFQTKAYFRMDRDGAVYTINSRYDGFLPCLEPLDQDGHQIREVFAKENPNGTILKGGSLYYFGALQSSSATKQFTGNDWLELGDSGESEESQYEWVVWDGLMFATRPIVIIPSKDLPDLICCLP